MFNWRNIGTVPIGIKTPIIKPGDDLIELVISSVVAALGEGGIESGDIWAITEAVLAIAQNNFVKPQDIILDVSEKFAGAEEIVVLDPIQSRNRFLEILKAIAAAPHIKKIKVIMTFPADEVGNSLISEEALMESGVNPYKDMFTSEEFYTKFGVPAHKFTGKNYIAEYIAACNGKGEVILCNDFSKVPEICKDILVCSIHRKEMTKKILRANGATRVLDLSEIMNAPINGSGYNVEYGLYGSNTMAGGKLKLMPRDCQDFVERLQIEVYERYGKHIEAMIFGDGAFKDPVGGIWELADPKTTLGYTSKLSGTPKEVKLKYLASKYPDKSSEEIEEIIKKEKAERMQTSDITGEASLGTTPRQITDLVASLCDLTVGSGDKKTPIVVVKNYWKKDN